MGPLRRRQRDRQELQHRIVPQCFLPSQLGLSLGAADWTLGPFAPGLSLVIRLVGFVCVVRLVFVIEFFVGFFIVKRAPLADDYDKGVPRWRPRLFVFADDLESRPGARECQPWVEDILSEFLIVSVERRGEKVRVLVVWGWRCFLSVAEGGDQVNCLFLVVREGDCHFDQNGARGPRTG